MNLSDLTRKAKDLLNKRGGTESARQDAQELKDIATGPGSMTDKAKEAFDAVKEPGAPASQETPRTDPGAPASQETPRTDPGAPASHDAPPAEDAERRF